MASVAADTSAIAPSPPLPSRSDAAPPAGPPGAFADLLDAPAASAMAPPQVQGAAPASRATDDASDAGQNGAAAGKDATGGASVPSADAVTSRARNGKDAGSSKVAKDNKDSSKDSSAASNSSGGGSATIDATAVAGLASPPTIDLMQVAAGQNPTTSGDAQTASADPAPPADDAKAGKSAKAGDPTVPSGPLAAALVVATVAAPLAPPQALAPTAIAPAASPGLTSPKAATPMPSTPVPAIPDPATTGGLTPQRPDAAGLPGTPAPAAAADSPATAAALPLPAELPAAVLQVVPIAGPATKSDQNVASAAPPSPAIMSAAAPSTFSSATPVAPLTSVAPPVEFPGQPARSPGAEPTPNDTAITLPAQVAVKFAASARATDDGTSDPAADGLLTSASVTLGGTTTSSDGQPGTTIQSSFNAAASIPVQAAPTVWTAPLHAAVTADAVPIAGIPIVIAARAEAGEKTFEIRLDPPDLGRIEVRLNVDSSGRATSHLVVDRADTLDLLRRDAPALERALQSAGLTTDDGALQFSLRDQSFAGRDQGAPAPLPPPAAVPESDLAPIDTAVRRYGQPAGLGGGIDIRV